MPIISNRTSRLRAAVFLSFFVGLISTSLVQADDACDSHFFDRSNLEKLAQEKNIKSIAQLLKLAPACFKANQAAVYRSSGLQCATAKAPRIVLYVNDEDSGNTVCTFNSGNKKDYEEIYKKNPGIDCHENALECQHFDATKNRFEYYEMTASQDDQGHSVGQGLDQHKIASLSPTNSAVCMSCHRGSSPYLGEANPRPNLENYPAWPGFYGSLHDKLGATPNEKEWYLHKFLPYKPTNPRYAALPDAYNASGEIIGSNSKPIVNLQNILESQNERRIASEFTDQRKKPELWPYRYAILGALACDDDHDAYDSQQGTKIPPARRFGIESFLPDELKPKFPTSFSQVASTMLQQHQDNLKALNEIQSRAGKFHSDQFEDLYKTDIANDPSKPYTAYKVDDAEDFYNTARLAYLGLNLGLPANDWSMSFRQSFDFEAGRHNVKELLPILANYFLNKEQDKDLNLTIDTHLGAPVDVAQCELLRKKSLTALGAKAGGDSMTSPACIASISACQPLAKVPDDLSGILGKLQDKAPSHVLNMCMSCHVYGSAVPIPFGDRDKLTKALGSYSATHPTNLLMDEISQRIDSGKMPPTTTLSPEERRALKSYLRDLLQK